MIEPMLLDDVKEPFESDEHIAELKLDGIRGLFFREEKNRLYSRHKNEITDRYPEIIHAGQEAIEEDTIIDGEIIVSDLTTGKPDFEAGHRRFLSKPPASGYTPGLTYVVFDILKYRGQDVTGLDLMSRKKLLEQAVTENEVIKRVRYMEHSFIPLFDICQQQNLEGIVIKQKKSLYHRGQRPKGIWQRVVVYHRERCVVLGFSKKEVAWLLGVEREGQIESVGMVKYGITPERRKKVFPLLQSLITHETDHFAYVQPFIQVGVDFRNWTTAGKLRLGKIVHVHL